MSYNIIQCGNVVQNTNDESTNENTNESTMVNVVQNGLCNYQ